MGLLVNHGLYVFLKSSVSKPWDC